MQLKSSLNNSSDIDLAIQTSKQIESTFESNFKATGRGLHEKLTSAIQNYNAAMAVFNAKFPNDLEGKIRKIATIRNKIVHESDVTSIDDRNGFIRSANEINSALQALHNDMISKNVQVQNVAAPPLQQNVAVAPQYIGRPAQIEGYQPMRAQAPANQVIMVQAAPMVQQQVIMVQAPIHVHDNTGDICCMYVIACFALFIPLVGLIAMCVYQCGQNMSGGKKYAFITIVVATFIKYIFYVIYWNSYDFGA
eukprot:772634_1